MFHHGRDEGVNLPIPNRERNNGGSLIVWSGHPQGAVLPPWRQPASEDDVDLLRKLESSQLSQPSQTSPGQPYPSQTYHDPGQSYPGQSGPPPSEFVSERTRKTSRPKLPIIILSVVLFLIIAGLIVVGTILNNKIAKLENAVSPLAVTAESNDASSSSSNNDNSNDNNNGSNENNSSGSSNNNNTPSFSLNNLNPSSTSTTPPKATGNNTPPPPLPPTILVPGWTYLGCYYDGEVRVLPDAFVSTVTMTNEECAEYCSTDGRKTRHFGTQVAVQCYCGTATAAVLASRRAPDWMCMHQCGGRWGVTENCGGNWALSLWEREGDESD